MDPRVTWAVTIMEQRLAERLRITDLAQQAGLSPSRFTRLFRRDTGMTPCRYQQALRLRRAAVLLTQTALSIREVMAQVGIHHPGHFARQFRQYHGFNPGAVQRHRVNLEP